MKDSDRPCEDCQVPLGPGASRQQRFCVACVKERHRTRCRERARRIAASSPRSKPPCAQCGGQLAPYKQRFCSPACCQAFHLARRRELSRRRKERRRWEVRAGASEDARWLTDTVASLGLTWREAGRRAGIGRSRLYSLSRSEGPFAPGTRRALERALSVPLTPAEDAWWRSEVWAVGSLLADQRQARGWTREQAADALGVEVATWACWERAEHVPGAAARQWLQSLLGVDLTSACARVDRALRRLDGPARLPEDVRVPPREALKEAA